MEIYRWDLDKTYLATDFDSVRGLFKAAREAPEEKRNVPGSAALLRGLAQRKGSRVIILSGSPVQMREVLSRKLDLDGIRYDELRLKDSLGQLKRGRFRAIKGQFGYKLPALLEGRLGLGPGAREMLFGDDAEVDALVYSVFADAVAGRIQPSDVARVMSAAGAYPDRVQAALAALEQVPQADCVERIFIRLERGVPPKRFAPLGTRVVPVYSWFQAALVLYGDGRLLASDVAAVAREVHRDQGLRSPQLGNLFQDILRRGHLRQGSVDRLIEELAEQGDEDRDSVVGACRQRARWLAGADRYQPPGAPPRVDYLAVLRSLQEKQDPER